jgi:MerR family transcriptional regulator/heat shock protein HspR
MSKGSSKAKGRVHDFGGGRAISDSPADLRLRARRTARHRAARAIRAHTEDDVERLEVILKLTRDLGVNLAGVEIILNMREKMAEMQRQIEAFVSA